LLTIIGKISTPFFHGFTNDSAVMYPQNANFYHKKYHLDGNKLIKNCRDFSASSTFLRVDGW
jgi:hypothetical protein